MKKLFVSILAGTMLFAACKKDDTNEDSNDNDNGIDPRDNSTWVYKISKFNEIGDTIDSFTITLKATTTTIGGTSWLKLTDSNNQTALVMKKKADGWWYMDTQSQASSLLYKNPVNVGETYPYIYGTINVEAINSSLTVPAGKFTDVTYVKGYDTNSLEDEFWFTNSGAVIIKSSTYDAKSGQPAADVYEKECTVLVSFKR